MRTYALRSDRYVRWSQRSFCWRYCLLLLLSHVQAVHPQGHQKAGEFFFLTPMTSIGYIALNVSWKYLLIPLSPFPLGQVYALIEHADSPYIRGVGFMFLRYLHLPWLLCSKAFKIFRYTLPPQLMWDWFEPYLDDEEVSWSPLSMPSAHSL